MIELRRLVDLGGAPAAVWERLWDVHALAGCIPGCEDVQTVEDRRRYRATIRDRIGPFRIVVPLDVTVEEAAPARLVITATGRDATLGSPVTIGLTASVEPRPGGSRLALDGRGDVGGKLAALGQGVIDRKTRDILDRFASNLAALFGGSDAAAL